jgi:hypothetical protein
LIPTSNYNLVAQLSHVGWGLAIVFGGKVIFHGNWYLLLAALWIVFNAVKEGWYDQRYEDAEMRGNSWEDFSFAAGSAVAASALTFWLS